MCVCVCVCLRACVCLFLSHFLSLFLKIYFVHAWFWYHYNKGVFCLFFVLVLIILLYEDFFFFFFFAFVSSEFTFVSSISVSRRFKRQAATGKSARANETHHPFHRHFYPKVQNHFSLFRWNLSNRWGQVNLTRVRKSFVPNTWVPRDTFVRLYVTGQRFLSFVDTLTGVEAEKGRHGCPSQYRINRWCQRRYLFPGPSEGSTSLSQYKINWRCWRSAGYRLSLPEAEKGRYLWLPISIQNQLVLLEKL